MSQRVLQGVWSGVWSGPARDSTAEAALSEALANNKKLQEKIEKLRASLVDRSNTVDRLSDAIAELKGTRDKSNKINVEHRSDSKAAARSIDAVVWRLPGPFVEPLASGVEGISATSPVGLNAFAPSASDPGSISIPRDDKPRILFSLAHPGFLRNFSQVIERLAPETRLHLHFSKRHDTISLADYMLMPPQPAVITCSFGRGVHDASMAHSRAVRLLRNIMAYAKPEYRNAVDIYQRFASLQKGGSEMAALIEVLRDAAAVVPDASRAAIDSWLRDQEQSLHPSAEAVRLIKQVMPDLVVVSPYVNFGADEVDVVKAAKAHGVRTVLAVASWDNLTNKGLIQVQPDHIAVWNRHMEREAIEFHGAAPSSVWRTGAAVFDTWFRRGPTRDRSSFCRDIGLDPNRRLIVYVCSSEAIAGKDETPIIESWMSALDVAESVDLRDAGILVRPHPMHLEPWGCLPAAPNRGNDNAVSLGRAIVWPVTPKHPTTEESRAEFFDTLHYADAIVGLNTSVMIEAAILRKPVLTFRGHAAETGQTGNQHFKYLANSRLVCEAASLSEHVAQLAGVLSDPEPQQTRCDAFVADFVRPEGLATSASHLLARHLLDVAAASVRKCSHE